MNTDRLWPVTLTLAVTIHLGIAMAWAYQRPPQQGAKALGSGGTEISLGLAGSYIEQAPKAPAPAPEPPAERRAKASPPAPDAKERPRKTTPTPRPKQPAEKKTEPTAVKPTPQPKPEVRNETAVQPSPAPNAATAAADAASPAPRPVMQQATGSANREENGGQSVAKETYYSRITAKIARNKRYPKAARKDGVSGITIVSFGISANGQLISPAVKTSSGDERLDRAAIEILQRSSPFPPPPSSLGLPLSLSLPVEFSLQR